MPCAKTQIISTNLHPRDLHLAAPGKPREKVRLGKPLNSGAAGAIYAIEGDTSRVVKLYNAETLRRDGAQYEAKIQAMLVSPPAFPFPAKQPGSPVKGNIVQIAWPLAVARDKATFVGFAMPAIEIAHTAELEFMMNDRQAHAHGLDSNLLSRLLLAHNLAALVSGVHRQGHAVVDMKPVNMKFYKQELYMALLDCDGFSIHGFPAPQMTPDYLAPEYQGKTIAQPELQDRFALAVIIFRLLNFGIHPYQGIPRSGQVSSDLTERIRAGLYACASLPNPQVVPVAASAHESLPDDLRQMFDRAFGKVASLRPAAQDWSSALRKYAHQGSQPLVSCGVGHYHFAGKPCGNCVREGVVSQAVAGARKPTRKRKKTATAVQLAPAPTAKAAQPAPAKTATPKQVTTPSPSATPAAAQGNGGSAMKWFIAGVIGVAFYTSFGGSDAPKATAPAAAPTQAPVQVQAVPAPRPMKDERPYFGMVLAEGSSDGRIYLGAVDPEGPAARAGLRAGDRLVMLNGRELADARDLKQSIDAADPAKGYRLTVERDERQATGSLAPEMLDLAEWIRRTEILKNLPREKVSVSEQGKEGESSGINRQN